jgi:hypothetical protein
MTRFYQFTFQEAGRYVMNWWVATQTADAANSAIFALYSSPIKTGKVVVMGIIDVAVAPVTVSLVNAGPGTVYYASGLPLTATLMIVQDNASSCSNSQGLGNQTGVALVNVTSASSTLALINDSGLNVYVFAGPEVLATLVVVELV